MNANVHIFSYLMHAERIAKHFMMFFSFSLFFCFLFKWEWENTAIKIGLPSSEKGSTLKGKNLLPLGANSFLLE